MSQTDPAEDLERIRRARDSEDTISDSPEVYTCPIEGCSRTVIDDPSSLRSHVRQAGNDAHRFRTLNEDLDIELDEEAYHATWGPGMREQIPTEPESIYEPGDPWGPGAPKSEI